MQVLGVYSEYSDGKCIGQITLDDGRIKGSNESVQSLIDARMRLKDNDPVKTFDSLNGWGNGYLWIRPPYEK